eukprot:10677948-Ditylum_brightwellii.AAC.1
MENVMGLFKPCHANDTSAAINVHLSVANAGAAYPHKDEKELYSALLFTWATSGIFGFNQKP